MSDDNQSEHGVRAAFYDNLAFLQRIGGPTIECLCGESFCDTNWEEVGAAFDEHLKEQTK